MEMNTVSNEISCIAGPETDGSCVDIVRVREKGRTLFEYCGTVAGVKVVSNSNVITLDLVATKSLYTARGFFLQYQGRSSPARTTATRSCLFCEIEAPRDEWNPIHWQLRNGTLSSRNNIDESVLKAETRLTRVLLFPRLASLIPVRDYCYHVTQ